MLAAKIPDNEDERLATLQALEVLDTEPEERFDRVTRTAKRLFDVPIALVSLTDSNRQWFKSSVGLDIKEIPRKTSFCGHAVLGDQTFYVSDASKDSRFVDSPLVTGPPYIRFYAGYPLCAADGEKMGTLCIIDTKPKRLEAEDFLALKDLAGMIEHELVALQLASKDELTQIPNRRGFAQLAARSLNLCQRRQLPASLAYLDLDKFKAINDNFGHAEGDRALKLFSDQMQASFRDSDVYGRLGGDEFVVLLTGSDITTATEIIDRFSQDLLLAIKREQLDYSINFSHGLIDCNTSQAFNIDEALREADRLMYQNKRCET